MNNKIIAIECITGKKMKRQNANITNSKEGNTMGNRKYKDDKFQYKYSATYSMQDN